MIPETTSNELDPINERHFEEAERAAWRDVFEAAPLALRRQLGMRCRRVAGSTALVAPGIDHPLFNRAFGLCDAGALSARQVREISSHYREAGVSRFFLHVPERIAQTASSELQAEGLVPFRRSWVKYGRGTSTDFTPVATELAVVRADPSRRGEVAHILAQGFDLPPAAEEVLAALVGREGWHFYVALDETRIAGTGALFTQGRRANLAFAATLPAYRGRGAQGALMSRRIALALDLGCEQISSETGEAVPGDPQHSHNNMLRHGLRPVYVRQNWCLPGTTWGSPMS